MNKKVLISLIIQNLLHDFVNNMSIDEMNNVYIDNFVTTQCIILDRLKEKQLESILNDITQVHPIINEKIVNSKTHEQCIK